MRSDDNPVAVIDRVSILLEAFHDRDRLTLSELSRRTGFPRSSTHRMLVQLVRLQWIRRSGQEYELGLKMFEIGSLARHHDELYRAALPIMHQLHATTGMTVHLGVLDGPDVLYLERVGGAPTTLPTRAGGRRPALHTAIGKAMLVSSGITPELALTTQPTPSTERSVTELPRLRKEFGGIRERSVAFDHDESVIGLSCVAATIGDGRDALGAISVCGPTDRMSTWALITPIRMAALAAWRRAGDATRPRTTAQCVPA